ncbi:TPA: cysteine desulfurase [archaeon]|nr:cysteine desulfurase [Candidatus Naiadarchaeales archaeon SRR2090153.bin461]
MALDVEKIRKDFPILQRKIKGKPLIYLDSTATSQKPIQVINAVKECYENSYANIHRAVHTMSAEASEKYESAHEKAAKLINAHGMEEIVFTRNTTESMNLILYSWAHQNLKAGDEILTTIMEHHSNIVPWQSLQAKGIRVKYVDINEDYTLKMDDYEKLVTPKTKLVTAVHVSNTLGVINPVREIGRIAHDNNALFVVDAAQSVPHMPVDVKKIDADFLAFSSHKMLGPAGIGVLYGKRDILEKMPPFMYGGDMIKEVKTTGTVYNDLPWKFEAGTPNIEGGIGFGAALDYLAKIGMQNIRGHEKELVEYAFERLGDLSGLKMYGPTNPEIKAGVFAFNVGDAHAHDVASILDDEGIAVRSGHHCTMPLTKERLHTNSSVRASFYLYTTRDEIDALVNGIETAKKVLKVS